MNTYRRVSPTVSTVKKSHASSLCAWAVRNWVETSRHGGEGPGPYRCHLERTGHESVRRRVLRRDHQDAGVSRDVGQLLEPDRGYAAATCQRFFGCGLAG